MEIEFHGRKITRGKRFLAYEEIEIAHIIEVQPPTVIIVYLKERNHFAGLFGDFDKIWNSKQFMTIFVIGHLGKRDFLGREIGRSAVGPLYFVRGLRKE